MGLGFVLCSSGFSDQGSESFSNSGASKVAVKKGPLRIHFFKGMRTKRGAYPKP